MAPPRQRRWTVEETAEWVPWDAAASDEARAAARRVASLMQARAFFVSTVLERRPTNTMAEGIVGMFIATNVTLVEELLNGFLHFHLGRKPRGQGVRRLLDEVGEAARLRAATKRSAETLIAARNEFVHADNERVLPANTPRLTTRNIWARTYYRVPEALGDDLGAARARDLARQRAAGPGVGIGTTNDGNPRG